MSSELRIAGCNTQNQYHPYGYEVEQQKCVYAVFGNHFAEALTPHDEGNRIKIINESWWYHDQKNKEFKDHFEKVFGEEEGWKVLLEIDEFYSLLDCELIAEVVV